MRKKLTVMLAMLFCVTTFAAFAEENSQPVEKSTATLARISVWPGAWYYPKGVDVTGLSLGLPATAGNGEKVYGADLGFLGTTNNVNGCQAALLNTGKNIVGAQVGIVSLAENVSGAQVAVFNNTDKVNGAQVGIVNKAKEGDGFQIGLINIMDNGFCKIFPFFNFSVNK
jgi:hypothetical protein